MTKQEEFFEKMEKTFNDCVGISRRKNADYAGSNDPFKNFRLCEQIGAARLDIGIIVRLCDKLSRITNLLTKEAKVKDESITDTINDAINYLAILKVYLEEKRGK